MTAGCDSDRRSNPHAAREPTPRHDPRTDRQDVRVVVLCATLRFTLRGVPSHSLICWPTSSPATSMPVEPVATWAGPSPSTQTLFC